MSETPQLKRLKPEKTPEQTLSPVRTLVLGANDHRLAQSQPLPSSSITAGFVPLSPENRGRTITTYSQSPPRSPGRSRSPQRKKDFIKLSPVKNSRLELQKFYDLHHQHTQQQSQGAQRLYIHQLVLNNFKSYAGEQIVGPFHTSFSAVVGPNGSGKSNVIDSMLFVFGFRANKLRQDKLSELIHKSELYPDLKSCSVKIYFRYVIDNVDGNEPTLVEDSELIVERRAFKNNSSKYFIDGKESTYSQVTTLLKDKGIDLDHKRFLILQGEVENIAQMKPKAEKHNDDGLLEYLEDIIGTTVYKPQIEKHVVEIEALNEICIQKENRFEIVNREKDSLESGKANALEFLQKEKLLTINKSKLTQWNIHNNNNKIDNILTKLNQLNEQLQTENVKNKELITELDTVKSKNKIDKDRITELEQFLKKFTKKKRNFTDDKVSNEEILKNITQKRETLDKTLEEARDTITKCKDDIKQLESSSHEKEEKLSTLNEQLAQENESLNQMKLSLKDKTKHFTEEIILLEKDLEPWNIQIQERKSQIKLIQMEIKLISESKDKLGKEIIDLKKQIEEALETGKDYNNKVTNLIEQQQKLKNQSEIGSKECSNAKVKLAEMQDVLNSQRQKVLEAKSSISTAENKSKVLTALNRLQKSGRISGFFGRLGDLGVIDDKFDIAISTACPRLDDMVVDTVECGQTCIEFLRKNKLGYARFILLDKLKKFNMNKIDTPLNVPRLFDLIKPKEDRFRPAFYSVLRDTLIATDLNQANKVAYGKRRFRVVTLDGKLIDISGTMSGGGNYVAKGLMTLKSKSTANLDVYTVDAVKEMEVDLEEKEFSFKEASNLYHQMELELARINEKQQDTDIELRKLSLNIEVLENEMKLQKETLEAKEKSSKEQSRETEEEAELNNKLNILNRENTDLHEQSRSTIEKIDELKAKIMEIGGSKLHSQNVKVAEINKQIDSISSSLKKTKTKVKKTQRKLEKTDKVLLTAEEDMIRCSEELVLIENKNKLIEEELNDIDRSIEENANERDLLISSIEQKNDILKDLNEKINEFKSFEMEIQNKLDKLNDLLNHLKRENKKFNKQLESYKLRDILFNMDSLEEVEENSTEEVQKSGSDISQQERDNETDKARETSSTAIDTSNVTVKPEPVDDMDIDETGNEISRGIPKLTDTELEALDIKALEEEIADLEAYVDSANVDIDILEEYARRLTEYKERKIDLNDAVKQRDDVSCKLEELRKKRFDEFMKGFSIISMTLKEMYQMITMGGNAELELVDSLDPFSEGVTFSVMPPKKSWRNITNLSGGEKTLSSLALVFALHKYKPTPLYVMDEIDAALDFRNVSIVANYIKERTKNAQFIVISLRNNMFELSKQLVGIYKHENMTKSATLQNNDMLHI